MEGVEKQLLDNLTSLQVIKSQREILDLEACISKYTHFFPSSTNLEKSENCEEKIDEFVYGKIIEKILQTFGANWPIHNSLLNPSIQDLMVPKRTNFPMLHELLIVSSDFLKKSQNNQAIDSLIIILEKVVTSDNLFFAILDVCRSNEKSEMEAEHYLKNWKDFLQILVALPTKIANKTRGKISRTFTPDNYSQILSYHLVRAIDSLNKISFQSSIKSNIKMISMMISKIVLNLGAERFVEFIKILIKLSLENNNNMESFIQEILVHLERSSIEPVAILFLKNLDKSNETQKVFGNIINNEQWRYVLITKIPLLSYYDNDIMIINLISYLSSENFEDSILIDLTIKLMDVWGDRSALNHTSLEQHEYLTKLILLSIKMLEKRLKPSDKDAIQRLLFSGTSAHLENMKVEVRGIGMIVGEMIFQMLTTSPDAPKLSYDYDKMPGSGKEMVDKIKKFMNEQNSFKTPEENSEKNSINTKDLIEEFGKQCCNLSKNMAENSKTEISQKPSNVLSIEKIQSSQQENAHDNDDDDSDLDSDDDLVPYDMSNDTGISDRLRPVYLRDLKENLINNSSNSEPDKFSEALKNAEDLILSQLPNDDSSLAIELLEILSTLKEISFVENFEILRYKSCVAIVTVYPKQCAEYLCKQFHAKMGTYSVTDRLFFLEVLSEAAKKLSATKPKKSQDDNTIEKCKEVEKIKKPNNPFSLYIDITTGRKHETLYDEDIEVPVNDDGKSNWEEIVEQRIKSNTRVFAHKTKMSQETINKFNDVVSSFFYPLLYGLSQREACMYKTPKSFEDQDNILLIHFLKTLSTIMVAAQNCIIAPKIGLEILELAWTLRYHEQAKVRLCVIENIASVIISISRENFSNQIIELLLEFRMWLFDVSQDSLRGDPDTNCRNLGRNVTELIDSVISTTIVQS